jgi:hypothetical protein
MMYACGDLHMHTDLGLWISRPDLGQPSLKGDHGKNVKASINNPKCERGQYSQSNMGAGTGWTTLHQHWQHACSSYVCVAIRTKKNCVNVEYRMCKTNLLYVFIIAG